MLHQVFDWHNMMSNGVPPSSREAFRFNILWDDLFHVFAWLATALGVIQFWRAARRGNTSAFTRLFGGLLLGFAVFNLVEGVLDHRVLRIHNVREVADPLPWNLGFLAASAVIPLLGALLARRGGRDPVTAERSASG